MIIVYYLTPNKRKNITLFIGSLLFYFLGEPRFTIILLISILVDYSHSLIIVRYRGTRLAKIALISSIVINLCLLGFFKYSDFLVSNVNSAFHSDLPLLGLTLPIGISFFTFQTMSYTIDVYRGEAEKSESLLGLGTYVALFPQLIAGPIVRYKTVAKEIVSRQHTFENFAYGVQRFIIGLAKKVLLANTLGELSLMAKTTTDPSMLFYWIGAVTFALQIYFDFSGYSDMAIGLGRIFGFHFLENFNYPYISRSISEFWNRWHMSLGRWFKDYVYIPLGGNRKGKLHWFLNILIVWFLTGLWHGASWNFILWGLFLGMFIIVEKIFFIRVLEKTPKVFSHLYVVLIIIFSFVIFNNNTLPSVAVYFKGMFGQLDIPITSIESLYYMRSYIVLIVAAIIGATPMPVKILNLMVRSRANKVLNYASPIGYLALLIIVTGYIVDSSFNPFLYFRF
jgi:alginate O-acetyltransferase complex protein AlgI